MSFNKSEERLGELTRRTFLSMWTYQSPHYAKGKELCDALVVFGNDVIIISDKLINFDDQANKSVAWERWYRKAVAGSIRQLRGAFNQLVKFPERIFCDVHASSPFPLVIPKPENMRVHLIAVANGCDDAHLRSLGYPGLCIDTHCDNDSPFMSVGVKYPEFVHVFSTAALEAIFNCFDTTRDLIDYLARKQEALNGEERFLIHGEENLVAAYVMSQSGNSDFYIPSDDFPIENGVKTVPVGLWDLYAKSPLREKRDKIRISSYVVDDLIDHMAEEYNSGSLIIGQDQPFSYHEKFLRIMASESRLSRQIMSKTLQGIIYEDSSTFWCNISESKDVPGLMYLWLVYPVVPEHITDEDLEIMLTVHLSQYITVALYKFPHATSIFGICLPNHASNRRSRGFQFFSGESRCDEMKKDADKLEQEQGILNNIETYNFISQRL
ncbi:hypothetical protein PS726_02828 [Pseudomonas fluorescens]|uniref:hypothetical protein n=1 Tax=Pseudomonas fluorescens TaxID=294 RepID=UPI001241B735|nr:hypothetical protein [Pseudomonas fluorescens]VVO03376.1 hypothetical protein PS726_02828 [Pseudomonas fluorescens]